LALARLVENGYGAAVVSNTVHGDIAALLSRTKLCSVDGAYVPFAAIIDSQILGVGKPDSQPFLLALGALGQSPEHCAHVGDSLHNDVVGAIGVGMTAIHIDPLSLCGGGAHGHFQSFAAFVDDLVPEDSLSR
jgi:putative hydrolase of the HAD superfamily